MLHSGTTLALVSDTLVKEIYKAIPGSKMDSAQGGFVFPEDATVPDVALAVGDSMFTINAADFAYGTATNGMLFGGIQSRGDNPFDILGDSTFACLAVNCMDSFTRQQY